MYPLSGHEKYHFYILSQTGHQNNTIDILISLDIKKMSYFYILWVGQKKIQHFVSSSQKHCYDI